MRAELICPRRVVGRIHIDRAIVGAAVLGGDGMTIATRYEVAQRVKVDGRRVDLQDGGGEVVRIRNHGYLVRAG